jgi:hypothetical protein
VTRAADDDLGAARAAVRSVVASAAKRFGAVGIAALPLSDVGEGAKTALLDVTRAQWGAACAARARVRETALAWCAAASATLVLASDTLPWGGSGRLAAAMSAGALRGLGAELQRAGAGRSRCIGVDSDAGDAALRSCVRRAAWHALHGDVACGLLWTAMSTAVDHDSVVRATADQEKRAGFGRDTVVERAWGLLEELPSNAQLSTLLSDTAALGEGGAGGALAAMASGSHVTAEQLMSQLSAAGDGDVGRVAGEFSFIYRYILRESCSQFDSLPLTSLTIHWGALQCLSPSSKGSCVRCWGDKPLVQKCRSSKAASTRCSRLSL